MNLFVSSRAGVSRLALALLAGLLFLVVAAGCGGGGGGGGRQASVTGIVLDASRGDAPVVGALVEIGGRTGTTGEGGVFTITGVQAGAFSARITPPGGAAPQTVSFSPPIAPGAANNVGELIINIGSVAGRVLLPNGQPAAGAFVSALTTGLQVNADATGRFVLPNLPAGPTQISAFLGTASVTVTVTVGESGETNVGDLTLQEDPNPIPPPAPVNIVGTVTLADTGAPAAGASVRIFRAGAATAAEQTVTDAQGRYSTFVPAGVYRVVVGAAGYQEAGVDVTVANPGVAVTANVVLPR